MRLTLVLVCSAAGAMTALGSASAQDRYSATSAPRPASAPVLRGAQLPATPAFAAQARVAGPARSGRTLTWPGKVLGPSAFAPLQATSPAPRREMASLVRPAPQPRAAMLTAAPTPQAAPPPPAAELAALPSSIYAPPPALRPAPAALRPAPIPSAPDQPASPSPASRGTLVMLPPASVPAQAQASSGNVDWPQGPGVTATETNGATLRRPASARTYAGAQGGAAPRQYSVHRQYGGAPDPIRMPADFFSAPADLAAPPPPVPRRVQADGKTPAQVRAAEARADANAAGDGD